MTQYNLQDFKIKVKKNMASIFSNNLLKSDSRAMRIVTIAAGLFPLISIFITSAVLKKPKVDVEGSPSPKFFMSIWIAITLGAILWAVICGFRTEGKGFLIAQTIGLCALAATCCAWLLAYDKSPKKGVYAMGFLVFIAIWLLVVSMSSDYDLPYVKLGMSSIAAIIVAWSVYAMVINFFDANSKKNKV